MTLPSLPNPLPNGFRTPFRTVFRTLPNLLPNGGPNYPPYYVRGLGGPLGPHPQPQFHPRPTHH